MGDALTIRYMPQSPQLVRRLGTGDAVVIGLGAMIGAGVFAAFAPAAAAAGTGLLVGLLLAAMIAYCNAAASAQLAAAYPTSGGTYAYGRERLGPWWGFAAGWGFIVGKTASCAVMALTFAAYAVPGATVAGTGTAGPEWRQRFVALAVLVVLTVVNLRGVTKTVALTRALVALTLIALSIVVAVIATSGEATTGNVGGWESLGSGGAYGVLQAAGLLFFAFAGYARVATLGEEVRDPARTIPRAIPIALLVTVGVYLVVGTSLLLAIGPDAIARSAAPLATAVSAVDAAFAAPVVRVGAAVASLGALLGLVAGLGRTTLAMAREGDLPRWLDAVHPRHHVPHRAEIALALVVGLLILTTDLRGALGFSSFGVLVYYAIANASAFTQPAADRRWPRALNVLGLVGCLVLIATLPPAAVLAGVLVFAVGLAGRLLVLRRRASG